MDLPSVDVDCLVGWWVLNCGGYRTTWRVVLWSWLRCIVGQVCWLSVRRLVCFVVGKSVWKWFPIFRFVSLAVWFISCMVWSAVPYSLSLFRIRNAYAEIGLLVLMYLLCSQCPILINFPVWPTYELLHVLHFNLYKPLEFILFNSILSWSWLYRDADKSLARPGMKEVRKHVRDARDFNKIETRAVIKFLFLQGKAPKEIHAILTEILACFLPGRAKDLSVPPYVVLLVRTALFQLVF